RAAAARDGHRRQLAHRRRHGTGRGHRRPDPRGGERLRRGDAGGVCAARGWAGGIGFARVTALMADADPVGANGVALQLAREKYRPDTLVRSVPAPESVDQARSCVPGIRRTDWRRTAPVSGAVPSLQPDGPPRDAAYRRRRAHPRCALPAPCPLRSAPDGGSIDQTVRRQDQFPA
nr:hypothetical protein [Tanacetum cinerariifolium]